MYKYMHNYIYKQYVYIYIHIYMYIQYLALQRLSVIPGKMAECRTSNSCISFNWEKHEKPHLSWHDKTSVISWFHHDINHGSTDRTHIKYWLVVWNMICFSILGISSSQLTIRHIFLEGLG